jgi:elongation factor G
MLTEFAVTARTGAPQVAYRESITRSVSDHHYRLAKQTGGSGQFADIKLSVEPLELNSDEEFVFEDTITGGRLPKNFITATQTGCREALAAGSLMGMPVVGVKVTLVDGSTHPVDSSEMAFRAAGAMALKEILKDCGPILIEPVMAVAASCPDSAMGTVVGDINSRRGTVTSLSDRPGGIKVVDALVPLAEMFGYSSQLRSMTQGRGSYSMEPNHYAAVPKAILATIKPS